MNIIKNIETTRIKSHGKKNAQSQTLLIKIISIAVLLTVVFGAYPIVSAMLGDFFNSKGLVTVLSVVLTGGLAYFASNSVSKKFDS